MADRARIHENQTQVVLRVRPDLGPTASRRSIRSQRLPGLIGLTQRDVDLPAIGKPSRNSLLAKARVRSRDPLEVIAQRLVVGSGGSRVRLLPEGCPCRSALFRWRIAQCLNPLR